MQSSVGWLIHMPDVVDGGGIVSAGGGGGSAGTGCGGGIGRGVAVSDFGWKPLCQGSPRSAA